MHFCSAPAVFEVLLSEFKATSVLVEPLHQPQPAHFLGHKVKGIRTRLLQFCTLEPPVQPVGQILAESRFAEGPEVSAGKMVDALRLLSDHKAESVVLSLLLHIGSVLLINVAVVLLLLLESFSYF